MLLIQLVWHCVMMRMYCIMMRSQIQVRIGFKAANYLLSKHLLTSANGLLKNVFFYLNGKQRYQGCVKKVNNTARFLVRKVKLGS